jgi:hypothetical protein
LNRPNRAVEPTPHPFSHLHAGPTPTLLPPRVVPARDSRRRHALPQLDRADSGHAPDPGPCPLISSEPETAESLPLPLPPLMKPPSMALISVGRPFSPAPSLSIKDQTEPSPPPLIQILTSPSPQTCRTLPFAVHRSPCAPRRPSCRALSCRAPSRPDRLRPLAVTKAVPLPLAEPPCTRRLA